MTHAIFLSASVPDLRRAPEYARTADPIAITAAVTALVYVTLGRRILIWGGHPAITPMIWVVAESMGVDYGKWVKLYQSKFFGDEFPEDNERFDNVIFTEPVENDRGESLRFMRERMFRDQTFEAGVFIGGMAGIIEEFEMFETLQPNARALPICSTGGAAIDAASRLRATPKELWDDFDYVSLFHRLLNISPREQRYESPNVQPLGREERLWVPRRDSRSSSSES